MAGGMRLVGDPDVWELRVYVGRDSEGRVRVVHRRFRGARRAAERELARLVTEQETAPTPVAEASSLWGPTTTVIDAVTAWKANGWSDPSPTTASDYETVWTLHIEKSIGRRLIAALTPFDVEQYLRTLKDSGRSQERVRRIRAILHRAVGWPERGVETLSLNPSPTPNARCGASLREAMTSGRRSHMPWNFGLPPVTS